MNIDIVDNLQCLINGGPNSMGWEKSWEISKRGGLNKRVRGKLGNEV